MPGKSDFSSRRLQSVDETIFRIFNETSRVIILDRNDSLMKGRTVGDVRK